jgi:hypothetical protein
MIRYNITLNDVPFNDSIYGEYGQFIQNLLSNHMLLPEAQFAFALEQSVQNMQENKTFGE